MSNILAPWLWASLFALLFNAAPKRPNHQTTPKPPSDPFHLELNEKLASRSSLYNPEKLYLHTDRTLYKPGEDLWYNAFLLNADDLKPSRQSQILYVELLDPRGSVIAQSTLLALGGQAAGDFNFPAHLPGGQYKLRAQTLWMKNTDARFEREITLQKVVLPRINLRLEWERKAVGPGEVAIARFDAQSLDNKPLAHHEIQFEAAVSGEKVTQGSAKTDANGRAYVRFELPQKLESIDGLLNITLVYHDQTEAISRPIPIVLDDIDLQFFPEGGEAVAGQPCRMAFKAVNEFGKAADISGEVINGQKEVVATFSSYHNGMGAFDFIPQRGEKYQVRLSSSAPGSSSKPKLYELPKIAAKGHTLQLSVRNEQSLQFTVYGTHPAKCYVAACSRDKVFFFSELPINQTGMANIVIPTEDCPIGIVRVTLFDEKRAELAERLVFVNRDKGLKFNIITDKEKYLPREEVKARIQVTDHNGQPVQGRFSVAVADEKQLSFADDKQGHLLAEMLLAQDLKGTVEEPNFYFDATEAKSEKALDYLLLTQGWRRFSWEEVLNPQPVAFQHKPEKARIAGILLDNKTNQPLGNHKLRLANNGPANMTSPEGHFVFESVDLQRFNYIMDEKGATHNFNTYFNHSVIFEGVSGPVTIANELEGNPKMAVLSGRVLEEPTGEPLIGASVLVSKNGQPVRGTITDYDGNYRILLFSGTGNYNLTFSYTGFSAKNIDNVKIVEGVINRVDMKMASNAVLEEVTIVAYKVPVIQQDNISTGQTISLNSSNGGGGTRRKKEKAAARPTAVEKVKERAEDQEITEYKAPLIKQDETATGQQLTSEQIAQMPTRSTQQVVATTAGSTLIDGDDVNIRGARRNDVNYYVDGVRVNNIKDLQIIENEEVIGNGTPADMEKAEDLDKKKMAKPATSWARDSRKDAPRQDIYGQNYPSPRQFTRAREFYVPKYDRSHPQAQASDLRTTIYWNPNVQTNSKGEAEIAFICTDEVTNFRITIEGTGSSTADFTQIGRTEHKFYVEKPLSVDVKLPASVISGDTLILQAVLHNRTDYAVNGQLAFEVPAHFTPCTQSAKDQSVPANSSRTIRSAYHIGTANPTENQMIRIAWRSAEAFEDEVIASVRTLDRGFPVRTVMSGSQAQNTFKLHLSDPIEGSVSAVLTAYPSTLDDVLKGMERMLRQPNGCFEQVSSSNYPNLLVLDLLRSTKTIKPEVESQALQYLDEGYKKLVGYECKPGGFDWYGRSPAHEALTAYGILEFTDMAAVYKVDQKMIVRALDWLLTRRDGKGGWQSRDGLHSWGNGDMMGAYIAWAMANSGYGHKIKSEIETAYNNAKQSGDLYQIALMANALQAMQDARANGLIQMLEQKQEKDGSWMGSKYSVTHSTGQQLRIETTALATLALLKAQKPVEKAIQYISSQKNEYGYGNTQSTVLALKALVEYAKRNVSSSNGSGKLIVAVDGRNVAERQYDPKQTGRIVITGLEQFFTHNDPLIEVYFEKSGNGIPFDIEIKYASRQPRNGQGLPFHFQTVLAKNRAKVGETVRLTATLHNSTKAPLASPMIILGIPSGLSLQPWQLKKIVEEKRCDYYELWDGYCVFHFESLPAEERRELHLDLRADIAGSFEASASQAYLYYANEKRMWSKPERLVVY